MTQIAFIGLGHMGLPMARNLLKNGFAVCVVDLVKEAVDTLVTEGAQPDGSAADAVRGAAVVVCSPPATTWKASTWAKTACERDEPAVTLAPAQRRRTICPCCGGRRPCTRPEMISAAAS